MKTRGRHNAAGTRGTPEQRFWRKVDAKIDVDACWPWKASVVASGYGQFNPRNGRPVRAHRFAYELVVGLIPEGLEIDHTCHDPKECAGGFDCPHRRCVNPRHLEAVTHRENVVRGGSPAAQHATQTHCLRGHHLAGSNLWRDRLGRRVCVTCRRARRKAPS